MSLEQLEFPEKKTEDEIKEQEGSWVLKEEDETEPVGLEKFDQLQTNFLVEDLERIVASDRFNNLKARDIIRKGDELKRLTRKNLEVITQSMHEGWRDEVLKFYDEINGN